MDNPEKKDTKVESNKLDVDSIYPNPKSASGPVALGEKNAGGNEEQSEKHKPVWFSIMSFIASMIPVILWTYCMVYYYTNRKPDVPGTDYVSLVFIHLMVYYYTVGIPFSGFAIGMGIVGLKKGLPRLAAFSLFLKACTVILVILYIVEVIP